MEQSLALSQLSALAQDNRLSVFRFLVKAGHDGVPAGDIASELGMPANTLSAQLNILAHAKLVTRIRQGRSIIYSANYDAISSLIVFLMQDCCQGKREVSEPVLHAAQACCAP